MENLRNIISILPTSPGIYQFFDTTGTIIYIGKAKNLKSRVGSYFVQKNTLSYKTKILVNQIFRIEHIIVESESDALLLENNLIKKYQPKYNVLLKDDKTFPWICIKNEAFPRVFSTRNRRHDGSVYFGPYTSVFTVKTLLSLIHQLYKIRTCKYALIPENIKAHKFAKCLEYHIGNCLAPCEAEQTPEEYSKSIFQIKNILKGNIQDVIEYLNTLMKDFAAMYKYEQAEEIKQKLELLVSFKSKSTVVNPKINDVEVYSYTEGYKSLIVNFMKISEGAIVQSHTVELQYQLDESPEDLLSYAIISIREKVDSHSKEIFVPIQVVVPEGIQVSVPKIGDRKRLLDLSHRNAVQYKLQKMKLSQQFTETKLGKSKLEQLQSDLRLKSLPVHIECFDNSNLQGTNPVAACVVFMNGKPAKKEYRKFHIKTVIGPDDFASMEEIIYRRYSRLQEEGKSFPQLIVIDGGKGQLSAARKSLLKLNLADQIPVLGIAKKLEELYFPDDPVPLYLDKNSASLKILQHLRNEAHRFGITFHRQTRSKDFLINELEEIQGVGSKTIDKLMKHFGSVENLRKAHVVEIEKVVPNKLAKLISEYLMK